MQSSRRLGFPLVIFVFSLGSIIWGATWLGIYWHKGVQIEAPVTIEFPPGMSLERLSAKLEKKGIITHPVFFHLLVKAKGTFNRFQAGTYLFSKENSPNSIEGSILSGRTHSPLALLITIPEGFTSNQIFRRIEGKGIDSFENILKLAENIDFRSALGISGKSLEGYLYPATYTFYGKKPSAKMVLTRMVREFFSRLPENFVDRLAAKGLSLDQGVVFGSLIEKESAHFSEYSLISEVIWNRLNKGIPLGIDAAVIYGIKDYDGNIRRRHLKDPGNPYNTRIHKGLTPTAICSARIEALKAILTPSSFGYLFYVLKPNGSKTHHFSKTLGEHNKHVRKLVKSSRL